MEFRNVYQVFPPEQPGEQKQMLNLNRRLEAYLNRVRLLEEENGLLAKEIQTVSIRGAGAHRRGLEEEVERARLEVEAAWKDRLVTELEVGKMAEELRALDLRRQREVGAKMEMEVKLEQSQKELEEEWRAQVWLTERVGLLDKEMKLLVESHRDHLARLEAELTLLRVTAPPAPAPRASHTPNLLQLEQEYSQRADRARQEAAEAHRGQLAQLEESLHQVRGRLTREVREGQQSRVELQALVKEIASAQEVRQHLEKAAGQQRQAHQQEVQQLQGYLNSLEAEKEKISYQIHGLLLENQGLLQMKMSLGLEVATYRALLDGEGFKGGIHTLRQPRHTSNAEAVFCPPGVKKDYWIHLSGSHKTTSSPCITKPTMTTNAAPVCCGKPAAQEATPLENSDPQQGEAVESLQPQEVHEKVTPAEALSPTDDLESAAAGNRAVGGLQRKVQPPAEPPLVESVVSHQAESLLSGEPSLYDDCHHFSTPSLPASQVSAAEEHYGVSDKRMDLLGAIEQEEAPRFGVPVKLWMKPMENEPDEHSDFETKAMPEPTSESRTSSPRSDCMSEDMVTEFNSDESTTEIGRKVRSCMLGGKEMVSDDKLYPDGEEMDTWDSVIERKVHLTSGEGMKSKEGKQQHAEPEEDILEHKKEEFRQQTDVQRENEVSSQMVTEQVDDRQHAALEGERDEDDSQNVSVSWRTEIESDDTLADTRPLIRYQSDETEANTQASHMDGNKLSKGQQDSGGKETGMWTEDKAKRFGTMEDLCEEIDGEMEDEQYRLEHVQTEETGFGQDSAACEQQISASEEENSECLVTKQNEKHSRMKTEQPTRPPNMDYDQEVEMARLEEASSQKGSGLEALMVHSKEHENEVLLPSSTPSNQMSEDLYSTASSGRMDQTHTVAEVQHQDHQPGDTPQKAEQDYELTTEIQPEFTDRVLRDTDDMTMSDEPESDQENKADMADHSEVKEASLSAAKNSDEDVSKHSLEICDPVKQPQLDNVEEWKELEEQSLHHLERYLEISDHQQQAEGAPETLPLSNKQPQLDETKEESRTSPPQSVEDFGSLKQLQEDEFTDTLNMSKDQPGLDPADPWELSHSSGSHSDTFQDKCEDIVSFQEDLLIQVKSEDDEDTEKVPEAAETAEWEDLEKPKEDCEIQNQKIPDPKSETEARSTNDHSETPRDQVLQTPPSSVLGQRDTFMLKDATESKKSDFWVSSLGGGATFNPPEDNNAAKHTDQNTAFAGNMIRGSSENQTAVQGNSKVESNLLESSPAEEGDNEAQAASKQE